MEVVADSAAGWFPTGSLPMGCIVQVRNTNGQGVSGRVCGYSGGDDGTYDVDCDNGERISGVQRELLTVLGELPDKKGATKYEVGEKVEGNYKGSGSWYPARVKSVNHLDGQYAIEYDDGDNERNVPEGNLRPVQSTVTNPSDVVMQATVEVASHKFSVNEEVMTEFNGKWYSGSITRVNSSGTYDVAFNDGDEECNVAEHLIRAKTEYESTPDEACDVAASSKFSKGDRVEAQFRGRSRWYVGKVVRVREDDHYDIDYDDGEQERRVPAALIRSLEATPQGTDDTVFGDDYAVGDKVLGNFEGEGQFFAGEVRRKVKKTIDGRVQMVYDIDYDDGDAETEVTVDRMKPVKETTMGTEPEFRDDLIQDDEACDVAASSKFSKGDRVEAQFRGRSRWYVGKVVRVREDDHYDIDYDDGEQERRVPAALIRSLEATPQGTDDTVFGDDYAVGDKVLGNFEGEGQFFAGEVRRKVKKTIDGRVQMVYDIDYDDGDAETEVTVDRMKPVKETIANPEEDPESDRTPAVAAPPVAVDEALPGSPKQIVPEDDLNDFLAGLSDDDDDEGMIGAGLDAGGSQYEGQEGERDDYGEDFED